ncbi:FAD-dependent oxidoreductase, partial [Candidatus Sumerlaeota bacterium]|nr:FAD-dependent oxidoreductase [Candidatus Sumerlaeota bacterium]
MADYDMIVIGAGPAGQKAALQAAKLRKHVAIVERESVVGGACVSTGTLPSKTLRETVHYLSGLKTRNPSAYSAISRRTVTF